jgi:HK97 family phage major capsid protein
MALTLAEAAKLSNDVLLTGVIETVVQESPVLQALPFIEVVGNGLTYNRENTLPSAGFFDVGDTWTESTPTFTQQTVALKILGGDADIDNFLLKTRSNLQDLEAAVVQLKAKATAHKFEDTFINGDTAVDAKSFDGIDKLTAAGQAVSMGANGGTLTLDKLDELIDKVKPGKPHLLLMSRRSRRKLTALSRATGSGLIVSERNQFGQMVDFYDGIPIGINDWVSDAKTVGTSTDCSTVYGLQLGEGAVMGLTAPGGLTMERVGSLESKDATRFRVKWYVALAVFNTLKLAKLTGVRD